MPSDSAGPKSAPKSSSGLPGSSSALFPSMSLTENSPARIISSSGSESTCADSKSLLKSTWSSAVSAVPVTATIAAMMKMARLLIAQRRQQLSAQCDERGEPCPKPTAGCEQSQHGSDDCPRWLHARGEECGQDCQQRRDSASGQPEHDEQPVLAQYQALQFTASKSYNLEERQFAATFQHITQHHNAEAEAPK